MIDQLLAPPGGLEAAALAVLFAATLCRATFGFGDGLIATPLLTLLVGARTASPVVALVSAATAALMLGGAWRAVDWPAVRRLVIAAAFGIPAGVYLLDGLPDAALELALGLLVLAFVCFGGGAAAEGEERVLGGAWPWVTGLAAGVLSGLWNVPGPPAVMFARAARWQPERFRASLQAFFLPTMSFVVIGHMSAGLHTAAVGRLFAWDAPGLLLALVLGRLLRGRIPRAWFERGVAGLLLAVSLLLLARGALRLL